MVMNMSVITQNRISQMTYNLGEWIMIAAAVVAFFAAVYYAYIAEGDR